MSIKDNNDHKINFRSDVMQQHGHHPSHDVVLEDGNSFVCKTR